MKALLEKINESLNIKKLNKYQISAIERAILKADIKFDVKEYKIDSYITSSDKYAHLHISYRGRRPIIQSGLICVFNTSINAGPAISELTYSGYNCNLDSFDYDKKSDKTIMIFKLNSFGINANWDHITGTCTITLDGNCVEPAVSDIKFDGKKYIEFMKSYLSEKEDYLKSFDYDEEIISADAELINKDRLVINIELEVGKGYSSHMHTDTYRFEMSDSYYDCVNHKLYDRDHEAQIVRKFISGFMKFQKYHNNMPQYIDVNIRQELD